MASVPATQEDVAAAQPPAEAPRRPQFLQNAVLEGLASLNIYRQLGLMLGLAASVAIGVAVVLWARGDDYRPLYGSLERLDSSAVLQVLDNHRIGYRIDSGTGALLVEADRIHDARLKLAEAGVPGEKSVGFELLDKEQPLGTSQFMETARYRRSLEGELARTIASVNNVRSARVHLAIPKESVFIRDARPASASVFVELFPGATLDNQQVRSIVNLVAGSIPELKAENVTVVDQRGELLSQKIIDNPDLLMANRQLEYTRRVEQQLLGRVNSILDPLLGNGRFRAEVSANVDFTAVEQAAEIFNPDLPAIRSEQRLAEARSGASAIGGVPGALSNQPPADGIAPEQIEQGGVESPQGTGPNAAPAAAPGAAANSREQYVRNYELDRTLSYTRHQVGALRRISVAVAVDNRLVPGPDGTMVSEPWDPAALEQLAILVRNSVGYDAARGDVVTVVNAPFLAPDGAELGTASTIPFWQQPWVMDYARQALGILFILVLVFGVLRPVMKSLSQASRASSETGLTADLGEEALADGLNPLGDERVTLTGSDSFMLPSPESSYEQQINAIKGMIAEDPGRVAQVVKQWVASSE
ncbi:MAG: flagellar basal-body MS-ring/collar protein FliF [Spongiibacteraceae bacterium]|jgi:flagellar M-ring protein FliF|nr:flagellar basal-body MS-ring/collar protein FliF [Spongiibacteraceae bacterium]